ncbi:MAG: FAD:protein FMN transferase [Planctomycetaceae bacterium]|nr:FAD:protein FMN transferase [Planctomycetaceae bacterium]
MRDRWIGVCVVLTGLCLAPKSHSAEPPAKRQYVERHMGVDVHLTLYGGAESAANDAAARAFARITALNAIFSDYEPDSEAMRLCRTAQPGEPVPVSPDLLTVLTTAHALSQRSDGAFAVTIGPVTKLWRRARRQKELPDPMLLAAALKTVDYRHITLDPAARTVTLARTDLQLDFGGIVKGYAAQQALQTLRTAGFPQSLVALAGDIAAGDAPPDAPGWKIGVAPLDRPNGPSSRWLKLANVGVSTSGDAYQFVEINGVRYSHIVDSKTGLGLTHRSSVTIIAPDAMMADGLATTATVLGSEAGMKLIADTPRAEGLFVTADGERLTVRETPGWKRWEWGDSSEAKP